MAERKVKTELPFTEAEGMAWADAEVDKITDIASAKTFLKKFCKKIVKILLES